MKKKLFVLPVLLLALSLAACGGSAGGGTLADTSAPAVSTDQNAPAVSSTDMQEAGWDTLAEPSPEPAEPGANVNAKIIYTANMDLETKDFEAASQALSDAVADLGGYFESRSLSQGGSRRSLSCTVRVPAENFTALLDRVGESAHVTDRSEFQDDVSESYYDQEARLTTQRTKLARLQELLSRAESMEDIIVLESAISDTELQIEYLTGSLRKYDSLIDYSTVTIYLREVYRLSTDQELPVTFGQRFAAAFVSGFQRGIGGLEDFSIFVAQNWVALLIWAAIIAGVVAAVRRGRQKRRARAVPPSSAPAAPPESGAPDSRDAGEKK